MVALPQVDLWIGWELSWSIQPMPNKLGIVLSQFRTHRYAV